MEAKTGSKIASTKETHTWTTSPKKDTCLLSTSVSKDALDVKAAVDKVWDKFLWDAKNVKSKSEVGQQAKKNGRCVHFFFFNGSLPSQTI